MHQQIRTAVSSCIASRGMTLSLIGLNMEHGDVTACITAEEAKSMADHVSSVDMKKNCLTKMPLEFLQHLTKLQDLDLCNNRITDIPDEITILTSLRSLAASDNKILDLPVKLCSMANLQTLCFRRNQLQIIPPQITQLTNLQELFLFGNLLHSKKLSTFVALDEGASCTTAVMDYFKNKKLKGQKAAHTLAMAEWYRSNNSFLDNWTSMT